MPDFIAGPRRRGRAFGIDLDAGFDLPGLPPPVGVEQGERSRRVVLDLAPRHVLSARDDGSGHVLDARGYGTFLVSADGTRVLCAPADATPWRWQRYLVGQVLPLVAVLHGFEAFHASVVAFGGRAVAFVGHSRAGKSTIAAALIARGATFVADDLLVVRPDDEPPRAWPGFGLTSLRHDALRRLPRGASDLGPCIGVDDDALRLAVAVPPAPLPLAALFFLERAGRPDERLVEVVDPVDPRLLLAGSYMLLVRTPERLTRHLDVCARLARTVDAFRVSVPPGAGPTDVAAAIESQAVALAVSS